jgi:hypothetical protein
MIQSAAWMRRHTPATQARMESRGILNYAQSACNSPRRIVRRGGLAKPKSRATFVHNNAMFHLAERDDYTVMTTLCRVEDLGTTEMRLLRKTAVTICRTPKYAVRPSPYLSLRGKGVMSGADYRTCSTSARGVGRHKAGSYLLIAKHQTLTKHRAEPVARCPVPAEGRILARVPFVDCTCGCASQKAVGLGGPG